MIIKYLMKIKMIIINNNNNNNNNNMNNNIKKIMKNLNCRKIIICLVQIYKYHNKYNN